MEAVLNNSWTVCTKWYWTVWCLPSLPFQTVQVLILIAIRLNDCRDFWINIFIESCKNDDHRPIKMSHVVIKQVKLNIDSLTVARGFLRRQNQTSANDWTHYIEEGINDTSTIVNSSPDRRVFITSSFVSLKDFCTGENFSNN